MAAKFRNIMKNRDNFIKFTIIKICNKNKVCEEVVSQNTFRKSDKIFKYLI